MKAKILPHADCIITELTAETDEDRRSIIDMIIKCQNGEGLGSWSNDGAFVQVVTKKDP
jgi:hypothetical protein